MDLLVEKFPFLKEMTLRCGLGSAEVFKAAKCVPVQTEFHMHEWVTEFVSEIPARQLAMLAVQNEGQCVFGSLIAHRFCCLADSSGQIGASLRISFLAELASMFEKTADKELLLLPIVLHTRLLEFLITMIFTHHDQVRPRGLICLDAIAQRMSPSPAVVVVGGGEERRSSRPKKEAKEKALQRLSDNCYSQLYDMDGYVSQLGDITFRSRLCHLQIGEQAALAAAIKAITPVYFATLSKEQDGIQKQDWLSHPTVREALSQQHLQALECIRVRLDAVMSEGKELGESGYFVKLSTRSPKDSLMLRGRAQALVAQGFSEEDSIRLSLRVRDGRDALELLCGSQRVLEDLERGRGGAADGSGVDEANEGKCPPLSLVVRKWAHIEAWGELRGFVNHRRLTALSQYASSPVYPQLETHREAIAQLVQSFFASQLAHLLPLDHAVVDFGLIVPEGKGPYDLSACNCSPSASSSSSPSTSSSSSSSSASSSSFLSSLVSTTNVSSSPPSVTSCSCGLLRECGVVLVELNPFGRASGASLFAWSDPRDYHSLTAPQGFEFRINTTH